jgi:hypothetical protein
MEQEREIHVTNETGVTRRPDAALLDRVIVNLRAAGLMPDQIDELVALRDRLAVGG